MLWRLHKTVNPGKVQSAIERLDLWQLKRLDSWLHGLIADREEPPEEQQKKGREVIARVVRGSGTLQLEMVRCGKCRSCPHGPYWYKYWKEAGRTRSKYVGKASSSDRYQYADQIEAARARVQISGSSPVVTSR